MADITVQSSYNAELVANSSYTVRTLRVPLDAAQKTFALSGGYPISIVAIQGVLPASQSLTIKIGDAELYSQPSNAAAKDIDLQRNVNVLAGTLTNGAGNLTIDNGGTPTGTLYITIAQKGSII